MRVATFTWPVACVVCFSFFHFSFIYVSVLYAYLRYYSWLLGAEMTKFQHLFLQVVIFPLSRNPIGSRIQKIITLDFSLSSIFHLQFYDFINVGFFGGREDGLLHILFLLWNFPISSSTNHKFVSGTGRRHYLTLKKVSRYTNA